MPTFNYQKAKDAGYSDEQINEFLSEKNPKFNIQKAQEAGYDLEQINKFLSQHQAEEPFSLGRSLKQYGAGYAGGAGGVLGDVAPLGGLLGEQIIKGLGIKPTHEISEQIASHIGVKEPQNAVERIMRQGGEWGGLEGLIGTATGGPVGAAAGTAHGTASGLMYGSFKELGMPDGWALLATALFTLSPIAAEKLIAKWKAGESLEKAASSLEKELPKGPPPPPGTSPPPSPPPDEFPFFGTEIPLGRKGFELAEEAQKGLQEPVEIRPQGMRFPKEELPLLHMDGGRSLAGRADIAKKEIEKPFPSSAISLPKEEPRPPLTGRAKIYSNEVGDIISPEKFEGSKQGGLNLSGHVKSELKETSKKVSGLYKKAEKVYKGVNDTVPALGGKVEDLLSELELTGKPSTAESVVIGHLKALQGMIGTKMEPIEVGMDRLIKHANSMSQSVNYEIADAGVKKLLKTLVRDINQTVIKTLKKQGKNPASIMRADKAYGNMAETFFNDEISPFLERNIRNPEALYNKATKDYGQYRALTEALYKNHPKSLSKYERDVVENIIQPFVKDIEKVGSKEFDSAMVELRGLIGKDPALKVEKELNELKRKHVKIPKIEFKKSGAAPSEKHLAHRVSGATVEKNVPPREEIPKFLTSEYPFPKEKITSATQNKVSKIIGKSPEQIWKMLDTPSGIRELKQELLERKLTKLYDKIVKEKTFDILRGDKVSLQKIKPHEVYEKLNNRNNYDILKEFYGEEKVDEALKQALKDSMEEERKQLTISKLKAVGKLGASLTGLSTLYRVLSIFTKTH